VTRQSAVRDRKMGSSPQTDRLTITFRCPQALDGLLPQTVQGCAARPLPPGLQISY